MKVLAARGVAGEAAAREFLNPRPQLTHDPLLLPDMEKAAAFLAEALAEGRRICVYGDYDVDGVCGTSLLVSFLKQYSKFVTWYIPNRIEEGYGLNREALAQIRASGGEVVVTVDCGSVSVDEVAYAQGIGLSMLITDHHEMGDARPACLVVNPKRPGSAYPYREICGCAVAFKLCCAVYDKAKSRFPAQGQPARSVLSNMIDLVAVATVADVMPLLDENRTFVKYGLSMIRHQKRMAFAALLAAADIESARVTARDIAFGISPRINAIGRLAGASEGVELFLSEDPARVREIAKRMDALNRERQQIQKRCFEACMEIARADEAFLLLRPQFAHEGVSGIVAGKVREATGRPCAVLAQTEEGNLKGSARTAGRLDLIALLRRHEELFLRLGGHQAAAGFLISAASEDALRRALCADLDAMLREDPDLLSEEVLVDAEIAATDVRAALAQALGGFEPFGNGNPKPALSFKVRGSEITDVRTMGADGSHLRFRAAGVPCVFFGGAEKFQGGDVEIIGTPEINEWQGRKSLQFSVATMRMVVVK
ncbi:MAG: single-stranded-DNA-specific exonuclease RecJ [Clostridiales Family XIII bacterium]|jgi:single-stranded-DNA-specific exonuclease|nr:single-stranded-DNA-specific exonuclease RecJ [Clostridiales Family XIII bacterium]